MTDVLREWEKAKRGLDGMFSGDGVLDAGDALAVAYVRLEERLAAARAALERLANPMGEPRTEEAALVQIEVQEIARSVLAVMESSGRSASLR